MTQVNITRPAGGDLIAHGKAALGTPSLRAGFSPPMPVVVVEYAPEAKFLNGETPTGVRYPNPTCVMPLRIAAPDEAAHQAIVSAWRAALAQLAYTVTIVLGNDSTSWAARPGQIVLAEGARRTLIPGDEVVDFYTVTIPVHPIPTA